ncbi:site-2 protease family protein [Candidatus Microgenomates bacterium]|nr:site-2 protease family protein [Candidatus Microgenomates bacterium]
MIIVGVVLFALLVIVHESGHLVMARRAGVEVEEFGIGFPPRLFARRLGKAKTLYSLNLIPLGGFVRLKGEADQDKAKGSFGAARFSRKAKILLAGVAMNILAAYLLVLMLAWTGMPQLISNQFSLAIDERARRSEVIVVDVVKDSAAAKAGIQAGSVIKQINGTAITDRQSLLNYTHPRPGQTVNVIFSEGGAEHTSQVELGQADDGKGQLGVVPFDNTIVRYSWSAPLVALVITAQAIGLTLVGLARVIFGLITEGTASEAVAGAVGPVGLFALLNSASQLGFAYIVLLIIAISISLAVINALPLPALDGGRLALISIFRAIKKPLSQKLESAVHTVGFVVLLMLVILISIFDAKRFF